jgi:hypothetical protein
VRDTSVSKQSLFKERYDLRFEADVFNIFNHPDFDTPNSDVNFFPKLLRSASQSAARQPGRDPVHDWQPTLPAALAFGVLRDSEETRAGRAQAYEVPDFRRNFVRFS